MTMKKENSAHSFTEGNEDHKKGIFEAQLFDMKQKRIKTETKLINITGGIIGIAALIWAGFAYGIELPVILFMIVLSNNLCNVK